MKRLWRQPWVMAAAAFLFMSYLRLALSTIRWRHEHRELAEQVWRDGGGAGMCLWHGRLALSPVPWPPSPTRQRLNGLISRSADGEFIARVLGPLGIAPVRGSRDTKGKGEAAKGGSAALRDMLGLLRAGEAMAITPDGPSGPAEVFGKGPVLLSRLAGSAPLLLVGLATRPCLQLKSWDRTVFPLPFARGAIVWDGPVSAPRDLDAGGVEALRQAWTERLVAATARAEALLTR